MGARAEFLYRHDDRINLAAKPLVKRLEGIDHFGESRITDDHQVNVASGGVAALGDGAEHECGGDFARQPLQGLAQRFRKTHGFLHDADNTGNSSATRFALACTAIMGTAPDALFANS
jgi:hypothetical protein